MKPWSPFRAWMYWHLHWTQLPVIHGLRKRYITWRWLKAKESKHR